MMAGPGQELCWGGGRGGGGYPPPFFLPLYIYIHRYFFFFFWGGGLASLPPFLKFSVCYSVTPLSPPHSRYLSNVKNSLTLIPEIG